MKHEENKSRNFGEIKIAVEKLNSLWTMPYQLSQRSLFSYISKETVPDFSQKSAVFDIVFSSQNTGSKQLLHIIYCR